MSVRGKLVDGAQAFVACYAKDIEISFVGAKIPSLRGLTALRKEYGKLFEKSPTIKTTVLERMADGKFVVDQEKTEIEGHPPDVGIVIYEVKGGKIAKVRMLVP